MPSLSRVGALASALHLLPLAWEPPYPGLWAGHELPGPIPLPARTLEALARGSAVAGRRYRLDGFEIGDATDVMPLPYGALAAAAIVTVAPVADRIPVPAVLIEATTRSGSNKVEADGTFVLQRASRVASGSVSGPLVKDHLWYAATLEVGARPRGLTRLTWQASARHKLTLLGVEMGAGQRMVGVIWDALLRDDLYTQVQVAGGDRPQARLRLAYFSRSEHALELRMPATPDPRATTLSLEDSWRATRHLTIAPVLVLSAGLVPGIGLAWDATHDGKTVVRGTASTRWPRLALGAARELPGAMVVSLDLLERTLALALRKREGGPRLDLAYARPLARGEPHHLRAAVAHAFPIGVTLGTFVTAEAEVWAGLRGRAEIGPWIGIPLALSVDLLGLPAHADLRFTLQTSL
jgi:hypothetical protein